MDSTVAAWLLKEQGFKVFGVTLALAEPGGHEDTRSCCSPELMARAKAVADHLGIPHYGVDSQSRFRKEVVDYFVSEYGRGRTPNPCSKCNSQVRFDALLDVARRVGAERIATGHYARLTGEPKRLSRAFDPAKDQSYVLAEVDPAVLEHCLFPLGELTKTQVRRIASDLGLAEMTSGESQEICFVPDDRYRDFLKDRLGEKPGVVVDEGGAVLAEHTGTYNYTIGQRKGLGTGGGPALYVSRLDALTGEVVASPEGGDEVREISFSVSSVHRDMPDASLLVQFRSMGKPVPARMESCGRVILESPARGVAPGQTIVLYHGDDVLIAGSIDSTSRTLT